MIAVTEPEPRTPALASCIDAITTRAERQLVQELALHATTLPPELARLTGTFRGGPVVLDARTYRGPATAYARVVRLRGENLDIGNVLAVSAPERALPILGIDLVSITRETLVAVADLSPLHPDAAERARQLEPLARRRRERPFGLPDGELPAWCAGWFSTETLLTRVSPAEAPRVSEAVLAYVSAYVALAGAAQSDPGLGESIRAAQGGYARAHVEHDRGLGMLKKLFDPALAERFLTEVLFPERAPAWP